MARKKRAKESGGGLPDSTNRCSLQSLLWIETFEMTANELMKMGYSRQAIESSFTRLWEDGMDTNDVAYVVSRVKEDLDGQTDHPEQEKEVIKEMASAYGDDAREEETTSARRADMLHRLQCTAAIPSSTDVINGFRQWYSVTIDDVFSSPTHDP